MTKHCNCKPVFGQIIQVFMRWSPFVLLIIEQLLKSNTLFQVPIVISENGSLQLPSHAFNFLTLKSSEPFFWNPHYLLLPLHTKEGRGNGNVVQPMVVKHEWSYLLHYHYYTKVIVNLWGVKRVTFLLSRVVTKFDVLNYLC